MALKNLKSNLAARDLASDTATDLTFGKGTAYDRPNQGFSLEPFIKGGINLGGTTGINSLTGGFIRGGVLMHSERMLQDGLRFGKFLISGRGITWNAKQLGLQKSNPRIGEPSVGGLLGSPANQRSWNFGVNTLAQVVGQGTGLHIKREGKTPLGGNGYKDEEKFLSNYNGKPTFSGKSKNTNRLLYLYDTNINTDPAQERFKTAMVNIAGTLTEVPFADRHNYSAVPGQTHNKDGSPIETEQKKQSRLGKFAQNVGQKIKAAFTNNSAELYSYEGGPGSTYGIGRTNIYKYSNTNTKQNERYIGPKNIGFFAEDKNDINGIFSVNNILFEKPSKEALDNLNLRDNNIGLGYHEKFSGEKEYTYERYNPKTEKLEHYTVKTKHFDTTGKDGAIRSRLPNYLATLGKIDVDNYNKQRSDDKSYHREERVNLGNPGSKPDENSDTTVDLINALDVFKANGDLNNNAVRDLIRFRIEAVDPYTPTKSNVMVFRAFLDDLNDNFTANYNEFTYNGRGENFYTYNGFNRDISFSFKIAAQSSREMKPLYRKLNYLLSNTAPEYHETSNRMMTPFMRLTIGSYFERLPGVIKNVGITWQKDYPWEICLDGPEGGSTKGLFVLPHVLDVNVTYQPVHDFLPQKSIHSPFIIPHEDSAIAGGIPEREKWNSTKEQPNIRTAIANRGK